MSEAKRKLMVVGAVIALLIHLGTLVFGLPWVYTVVQLETAKAQGVYATPEEGMAARLRTGYPDAERIEIEHAGPNSFDGSHPHVWYVIGRAWPTGPKARPQGYGGGSFFLRVREGWVHIPEGFFPDLIGLCMEVYGIS